MPTTSDPGPVGHDPWPAPRAHRLGNVGRLVDPGLRGGADPDRVLGGLASRRRRSHHGPLRAVGDRRDRPHLRHGRPPDTGPARSSGTWSSSACAPRSSRRAPPPTRRSAGRCWQRSGRIRSCSRSATTPSITATSGTAGVARPARRRARARRSSSAELRQADAVIASSSGRHTTPFWRPPYGAVDAGVRRAAASAGWGYTVMWTHRHDRLAAALRRWPDAGRRGGQGGRRADRGWRRADAPRRVSDPERPARDGLGAARRRLSADDGLGAVPVTGQPAAGRSTGPSGPASRVTGPGAAGRPASSGAVTVRSSQRSGGVPSDGSVSATQATSASVAVAG